VKGGPEGRRRLLELALSMAALALGAPGCVALACGVPLADWPIPLHPQMGGEIGLKTVVYLSGLLASFGAIGLVWLVWGDDDGPVVSSAPPFARGRSGSPDENVELRARPGEDAADEPADAPLSLAEPLYGFLPAAVQRRLAQETSYHALLFTKISILVTAAIGVLLAGSTEVLPVTEPIPPDAALRIGAGLYLMAESLQRYRRFARGEPSGTLVGTLVHGAMRSFRGGRG
jgi:hypothetical protein